MFFDEIIHGTQYYRSPTPLPEEWEGDIAKLGDFNLDTFQIRINWRWNEKREGEYDFSDVDRLMELAERFVTTEYKNHAQLFYLWGHSYEFESDNNWNVIESFAEYVGGKDDIWYATNIEIFEYIQAFNRLVWSADMSTVKNPSAIPVWVKAGIHDKGNKTIRIDGGCTVRLYEDDAE